MSGRTGRIESYFSFFFLSSFLFHSFPFSLTPCKQFPNSHPLPFYRVVLFSFSSIQKFAFLHSVSWYVMGPERHMKSRSTLVIHLNHYPHCSSSSTDILNRPPFPLLFLLLLRCRLPFPLPPPLLSSPSFSAVAMWFKTAMNRDVSSGPLALAFARSLAPLTHSLAPLYSLYWRSFLRSFASSLTLSRTYGKEVFVQDKYASWLHIFNPLCSASSTSLFPVFSAVINECPRIRFSPVELHPHVR